MSRMLKVVAVLAVVAGVATACRPVPSQPGYKPLLVGLIDKGNAAPFQVGQPFPVIDLSNEVASSPGLTGVVVDGGRDWSRLRARSTSRPGCLTQCGPDLRQPALDAQLGGRLHVFGADDAPVGKEPRWHTHQHHRQPTGPRHRRPVVAAGLPVGVGHLAAGARPALRRRSLGPRGRRRLLRVTHRRAVHHGHHEHRQDPAAGRRVEQMAPRGCLDGASATTRAWQHTAVYFPFNPFTTMTSTGTVGIDDSVTDEVMQRCADSAGCGRTLVHPGQQRHQLARYPAGRFRLRCTPRWTRSGRRIRAGLRSPSR